MHRNLPTPARVLAVGAHPDDVEFQSGATLAKWAAAGASVHLLVCTDGSKGSWDPDADQGELVAAQRREARAAAAALGADPDVTFLDWVDGEVVPDRAAVAAVAAVIRRQVPDVVLTHDPWKRYRLHPDHRNVGWIALDAVVAARDPHFFPEQGLAPHRPSTLLLFEADEPDHAEDVTDHVAAKLAALLEHRSQYRSTMHIDDPGDESQVAAFRYKVLDRMAWAGRTLGLDHAELFKAMHP